MLETIMLSLLSGTTVAGIFTSIRFWKSDKKLKEIELKKNTVEQQNGEIDLAGKYLQKVMEITEDGNKSMKDVGSKIEGIERKVDDISGTMKDVVTFLNGDFKKFQNKKYDKTSKNKKYDKTSKNN